MNKKTKHLTKLIIEHNERVKAHSKDVKVQSLVVGASLVIAVLGLSLIVLGLMSIEFTGKSQINSDVCLCILESMK